MTMLRKSLLAYMFFFYKHTTGMRKTCYNVAAKCQYIFGDFY